MGPRAQSVRMSLVSRQTLSPRAYDPDLGAAALAHVPGISTQGQALISGVAGCSPYLAELMRREGDWLAAAIDTPEDALTSEVARLRGLAPDETASGLRRGKRRIALLAGLADLAGAWPLETVTAALTDLADTATDCAIRAALAVPVARGKLPGMTEDDLATGASMVALAMGKMGAHELNYSSDIDLICLFDETRFDPDDYLEARAVLIRATRKMVSILADVTAEGYVFRTDLRLRPDPSTTPVCVPMAGAEAYYESQGRTWERAAYIKARPAAGDLAAGGAFLDQLRPFVWRKHLDYAAIQDAHDMRLKIRDHKGLGGALVLEGHNMKLGRGGIREIEFFAQTHQLVSGGRNPDLRLRGTVETLRAVADAGHLATDTAETLADHYRFHRTVEHRLQMVRDAQTHDLPNNAVGFDRLAAMMDRDVADLRAELTERLEAVHSLTEGYFAPTPVAPVPVPDYADQVTARWPSYAAMRSPRATEIFDRLRPEIFRLLGEAADPEAALAQFDRFLAGLPAGVQLFSLFEARPALTELVCEICARAPGLAEYMGGHVSVLDAVIGGEFFDDWPGLAEVQQHVAAAIGAASDYESQLIAARSVKQELHFRIGVHLLRGLVTPAQAGTQYGELAEATINALWPVVQAEFARRHGPAPGRGACVLGMGSLGAGRLHTHSDLDLLVIYDAEGQETSEGDRPLGVRAYYARLTQALITALKAPMSEGILYDVDMRLRPSGRSGPVATSFASFQSYQQSEAWTWEHLALTRARVVAGPDDLAGDIEEFRAGLIASDHDPKKIRADLAEMRERIAAAKAPKTPWDAKIGAGRLQDVELFAQSLALRAGVPVRDTLGQIKAGEQAGLIGADAADQLGAAARLCWSHQVMHKLISPGGFDPERAGAGARTLVLREAEQPDINAALTQLESLSGAAAEVISRDLET